MVLWWWITGEERKRFSAKGERTEEGESDEVETEK
jgi:hypothetical protein